ncbi:hypothetical protein ACFQH8_16720 [Halomicroarcula sp. GCM10025710]
MTGFNRERLDTLPQEYVDLIREFETYKNDTGKQSGTVQTYLVRVTDFFEWLVNHGNTPPVDDLNDRHAIRYTRWAESHYSAATYRSRIITTKNMFEVVETLNGSIWKRPEAGLPDSQEVRDSNKHGREIDITDMSKFFMSIRDPLWHAFFLTLLSSSSETARRRTSVCQKSISTTRTSTSSTMTSTSRIVRRSPIHRIRYTSHPIERETSGDRAPGSPSTRNSKPRSFGGSRYGRRPKRRCRTHRHCSFPSVTTGGSRCHRRRWASRLQN